MDSLGARRSQMTAGLDRAMELGARQQREATSPQHGLFGGGEDPAPVAAVTLPEAPEWSEADRLAGEKEVLGFYVTGHPLEKFSARLAGLVRNDSASIDSVEHDSPVTLAGILAGLKVRPSKKGDLWASASLEDMRGAVELLVFPQSYQQLQGVLKNEAALLIKGRVRIEENARPKVVVNEAKPLESVGNGGKPELLIRIDVGSAAPAALDEIEKLLAASPGENPVLFELTQASDFQVRLRPRLARTVKPEAGLLARLRDLCGREPEMLGKTPL
jgi:DNA polymerase-3 subunit alpha